MLKTIKKFFDKIRETNFKEQWGYFKLWTLTEENLYNNDVNIISLSVYGINSYTIKDQTALKKFAKDGGIVLMLDDPNLRKKVNYLDYNDIKFVITQDINETQYNKDINYDFNIKYKRNKNLFDNKTIMFLRLSQLYSYENIYTAFTYYLRPYMQPYKLKYSVKQDDDKALKEFVKKGGVILDIDDEHLRRKVKYCKKTHIQYIITTDIKELLYNKD